MRLINSALKIEETWNFLSVLCQIFTLLISFYLKIFYKCFKMKQQLKNQLQKRARQRIHQVHHQCTSRIFSGNFPLLLNPKEGDVIFLMKYLSFDLLLAQAKCHEAQIFVHFYHVFSKAHASKDCLRLVPFQSAMSTLIDLRLQKLRLGSLQTWPMDSAIFRARPKNVLKRVSVIG